MLSSCIGVGVGVGVPREPPMSGLGQNTSQDDREEVESPEWPQWTKAVCSVCQSFEQRALWYKRQYCLMVRSQATWAFYLLSIDVDGVLHLSEPQLSSLGHEGDSRACPWSCND